MNVTVDVDGTLRTYDGKTIEKTIAAIKSHIKKGNKVTVVTRRGYFDTHAGINGEQLIEFIKDKIGDVPVYFTNGLPKYRTVANQNSDLHYDDDVLENKALSEKGINTILVEEDKSTERGQYLSDKTLYDLLDKTLLFIDTGGIYQSYAERLAEEFGTVKYFSPWEDNESDLKAAKAATGERVGFMKINNYEKHIYNADVIFFPGCTKKAAQEDLIDRGFNVFGSASLADLENDREFFLDKVAEWGFPTGKYEKITGIDTLLEKLKTIKDIRFIKFSTFRSDMETYKHWNYEASKVKFEKLRVKQGAKSKDIKFFVFTPIEGSEGGRDTACIKGQQWETFMAGYEVKNKSYVCVVVTNKNMPPPMIDFADRICEMSEERGVSFFWSDESRVDKGTFYPLDFTARLGIPPNEIQQVNIMNLGSIIYYGAQGAKVEPIFKKKYAAQIILTSHSGLHDWLAIDYPVEYSAHIKLYNYTIDKNGQKWIIPSPDEHDDTVCTVACIGDTLEEAEKCCIHIAKSIKADGLSFNEHEFIDSTEIIEEGRRNGITYFD